jgi:hypothetical protein
MSPPSRTTLTSNQLTPAPTFRVGAALLVDECTLISFTDLCAWLPHRPDFPFHFVFKAGHFQVYKKLA